MITTSLAITQKQHEELTDLAEDLGLSRSVTMRALIAIGMTEIRAANKRSRQRVKELKGGSKSGVEGLTPPATTRGIHAQSVQWWRNAAYTPGQHRPRAAYLVWMAANHPRITPDEAGEAFDAEWPYQVKIMREEA